MDIDWGHVILAAGIVAGFLERLAEEASPETPVIGKYRGLIRAVARAIMPKRKLRPDPSPKPDEGKIPYGYGGKF